MKPKALLGEFRQATFVNDVAASRRTYSIFETPKFYIVVTLSSPLAGNFTLVNKSAVDSVRKRFGGKKDMTSGELLKRVKNLRTRFDALYVLYILEALGVASRRQAKLPARGFLFNLRQPRQ